MALEDPQGRPRACGDVPYGTENAHAAMTSTSRPRGCSIGQAPHQSMPNDRVHARRRATGEQIRTA